MNTIEIELRITSIRSRGTFGGSIFSGIAVNGERYVAMCDHHLIPDAKLVEKGQTWKISGLVEQRTVYGERFIRQEFQINALEAELLVPTGENIIYWIEHCPDCMGIGRVKATKLWEAFGLTLIDIIATKDIQKLSTVLTEDSALTLCNAFEQYRASTTLLWLDKVGIPRRMGEKVVKHYKDVAQIKIESNPYVLVSFEANWRTVDGLARKRLFISEDDPRRLEGAIEEALYGSMKSGHTCLPQRKLRARLLTLLEKGTLANQALLLLHDNPKYKNFGDLFQPTGTYLIERFIASRFIAMAHGEESIDSNSVLWKSEYDERAISDSILKFESDNFLLEEAQRQAVTTCVMSRFSLILGGAGTGKTTVLKALYHVLESAQGGFAIYQLALAGRAAQRMAQSTNRTSMTIAGFLANVIPETLTNQTIIVIDEVSMVDALLMYRLLRRIPAGIRLILAGDPSQLSPIGPGLVLHALAGNPDIPQTELTVVRRQEASSGIPVVASAVRKHQVPDFTPYVGIGPGVSFIECRSDLLNEKITQIYEDLGGSRSDYSVQILSATRGGYGGVTQLNQLLHEKYSLQQNPVEVFNKEFDCAVVARTLDNVSLYAGDLVMFTENNYDLGLRNGSLGKIVEAFPANQNVDADCCKVEFEGEFFTLKAIHLESLVHSYSITVHKSQGSQFSRVIIPITRNRLLDMSMVYTAITRGVNQVVLVGDIEAAKKAITSPPSSSRRYVALPSILASKADKSSHGSFPT